MEVAVDFSAIVTCAADPHLSLMVWVNVFTARFTVIVPADPRVRDADTDDARGISWSVTVPETDRDAGVYCEVNPLCQSAVRVTDPLPTLLWATVMVLLPNLYQALAP